MKTAIKPLLLFAYLFLLPLLADARIIYVNHAATGANDGTSWLNAFDDLSDGLSAASSGDELWITNGVYTPGISFDFNGDETFDIREVSFVIPSGVAIYGGFSGGEVSRGERDWETNLTILSGDIDHNDLNADGNGIAENRDHTVGSNAYHVVATFNATSNTKIDGLIITGGQANDALGENSNGAGWYCLTRSALMPDGPVISNCVFRGNFATGIGGAIYNSERSSGLIFQVENCRFIENVAFTAAGIYLPRLGELRMSGSEFIANNAISTAGALILSQDFSRIESTVFRNNSAGNLPENVSTKFRPAAGAIRMHNSNAFFDKCTFENNLVVNGRFGRIPSEGGSGGAIRMTAGESPSVSSPRFLNCGFYSNETRGQTKADGSFGGAIIHFTRNGILRPRYTNCVFEGNRANEDGGAVASFMEHLSPLTYSPSLAPEFTNCTFFQNSADEKGGAIYNSEVITGTEVLKTRLENCILWDNSAIEGNEVFNLNLHDNTIVTYSIVRGSGGSGAGWNNTIGDDGGNNLDINPGFADPGNPFGSDGIPATNDDGLRLASLTSPGVNTGNNSAAGIIGVTVDYPQNPRIITSTIDMGAYERSGLLMAESLFPWPECADCPWAFSLLPFDATFIWDDKGIITKNEDGKSATITGRIVSLKNKKISFDVYLKLLNQQDWNTWNSKNRTFTTYTLESADIAKKTIRSWSFWELSSESHLKGNGDVSGVLNLKAFPEDFKTGVQFGYGANGWDNSGGISGAFHYQGDLSINGKISKLKGTGTMNVDAEPCLDCSEYTVPNSFNETSTTGNTFIDIITFPVPATDHVNILSESVPVETYSVMLYDSEGNLKKTGTWSSEEGDYELALENLKSGLYVIKLTSSQGDVLLKKILVK